MKYLEQKLDIKKLVDIKVKFSAELGNSKISVKEFLNLEKSSVIDLEKQAGESVEIYINKKIIGKGEVMVFERNLAIRINEVFNSDSIIKYFTKEIS